MIYLFVSTIKFELMSLVTWWFFFTKVYIF